MITNLVTLAQEINEAWNSHDIERVIRFYSPDYIGEDVGQAEPSQGHERLRALLESYWRAFPDLKFSIVSTLAEGNQLAILWLGEGTHQGTIMNIPPTGHKVEVRGVAVIDIQDGVVVRGQYIWDLAGMLRHMGLLPELQTSQRISGEL